MVSRLVAARAAVMTHSQAALEELGREFRGCSFADVANALGGERYELLEFMERIFRARSLFRHAR
jgi:hypothetical protein